MEPNSWAKFSEYGLLGLVVGAMMFLLFMISKWVLDHVKVLLAQQADERKTWHTMYEKSTETLQKVVVALEKHDEKADERGRYVREEHKEQMNAAREIVTSLGRINGYKKD